MHRMERAAVQRCLQRLAAGGHTSLSLGCSRSAGRRHAFLTLQLRCQSAPPTNFSGSLKAALAAETEGSRKKMSKEEKKKLQAESGINLAAVTHEEKILQGAQHEQTNDREQRERNVHDKETLRSQVNKVAAIVATISLFSLGGSFMAVPLYKMYCTSSPQVGGAAREAMENIFDGEGNLPKIASVLTVLFRGSVGSRVSPVMFVPLQSSIDTLIGEPTLAFFNVYNKSDKTLIGLSTYNVAPSDAAPYFNKIQCFCFEEQRIKPHELIEMPVFYFVDKEYLEDPATQQIKTLLLNYTLFVMQGSAAAHRQRSTSLRAKATAAYSDILDFLDEVEAGSNVAPSIPPSAAGSILLDSSDAISLGAGVMPHAAPLTQSVLDRHEAHSMLESDPGTEAESMFVGVKAKIDRLQREVDGKDRLVEDLKREIGSLKKAEDARMKDVTRQAESLLKLQKTDFEHAVQRNLNTIEQLIEEKKGLVKQLDTATKERTQAQEACERIKSRAEQEQVSQATRLKSQLALADKKKREKWVQDESRKMKAAALKALEPDISQLLSKHKAELRRVKEEHEEEMRRKDALLAEKAHAVAHATARSATEVEDLAQQMREDFGSKLREQAAKYESRIDELQKTFTYERSFLERGVEEEKAAVRQKLREAESELRDARRKEEEASRAFRDSLAQEKHQVRLEMERQLDVVRDALDKEHAGALDVERMRLQREQDAALKEHEEQLARRLTKQRNEEIEKAVFRMEQEAARMEDEAEAEVRQLKERLAAASREQHKAEVQGGSVAEELKQVRLVLAEKEKDLTAEMARRRREQERVEEERAQHEEEFAARLNHAESLIAAKYESRVAQLEADVQQLRLALKKANDALGAQREAAEGQMEEQREKHSEELQAVQHRVLDVISKKDAEIAALKASAHKLGAKIKQTDVVLDRHKHLVYP